MTQDLAKIFRHGNGTATLEMRRPDSLNALSSDLIRAINECLKEALADDSTRVVVLRGVGKAFSAGADVAQMSAYEWPQVRIEDFVAEFESVIPDFPLPLIAAVHGAALGGGLELAMMCDILYVSDCARLGQPEIGVGTIPGIGGTQRLARLIGRMRAMEMILTGRIIDAQEAVRIGLAVRSFESQDLLDQSLHTAKRIAQYSQPVITKAKQCIQKAEILPLDQGIRYERRQFYQTFALEDNREGMRAFVEKRKPQFTHR